MNPALGRVLLRLVCLQFKIMENSVIIDINSFWPLLAGGLRCIVSVLTRFGQ